MKLPEAIEQGIKSVGDNTNTYVQIEKQALILLNEAGERLINLELVLRHWSELELPGETKD